MDNGVSDVTSKDTGGGYEFENEECWACSEPPDGLLVEETGIMVEVCRDCGEQYIAEGKWERYEDLEGWAEES